MEEDLNCGISQFVLYTNYIISEAESIWMRRRTYITRMGERVYLYKSLVENTNSRSYLLDMKVVG